MLFHKPEQIDNVLWLLPSSVVLSQWFCLQETCDNLWRYFWLSRLGEGCCKHLGSRSQGRCDHPKCTRQEISPVEWMQLLGPSPSWDPRLLLTRDFPALFKAECRLFMLDLFYHGGGIYLSSLEQTHILDVIGFCHPQCFCQKRCPQAHKMPLIASAL